ncbi:AraC family transcriptional regulator [Dehalobacterium formicoaceticum]|uniref:AraC family transcriptional regulator n=3 Tax=Dehalobacterium formicoaceticum TaxID=51515 RepID=A0ABT1Y2E2_9FIRM|nr:AraC family transcriptional regulator [Dehalobacterium formicoaceticum]MCR6545037.1 AraC family transcriptional regulator [Dehalobacterium formicoaceticum]
MRTIESRSQRIYYMEKEHKLKNEVRNCEYKDASLLLEKLLAEILTQTSGDMDALKMRVIELLVIVSRSALDGGADMNQVSKLNVRYYREVLDQFKIDEMCLLAQNMLKTFIDLVDVSKDKTGLQATQKAAEFIRKNFREKLTIDDIAQEVYLSPCYLSRIFKKSLGCTLMDYLAQVRVENARVMLKNPQYNVMQVAEENGFEDPGYFTRVFKKIEGITPSQYKQKAL